MTKLSAHAKSAFHIRKYALPQSNGDSATNVNVAIPPLLSRIHYEDIEKTHAQKLCIGSGANRAPNRFVLRMEKLASVQAGRLLN
jgi:hypothetical protein